MRKRKLKILANMSRYDYGIKSRGNSFEYDTFYSLFKRLGYSVELFDYTQNKSIEKKLKKQNYDLIFTFPMRFEQSNETLQSLQYKYTGAISLAWMADDKWRFDNYSKYIAHLFDFVVTTDPNAIKKYKSIGYKNVLLSQWGFDKKLHKKLKLKKKYDVSFLGGKSAWREYIYKILKSEGIQVKFFGTGWPNGRLTVEETVRLYNQSKIVLNLSNSVKLDPSFLLFTKTPTWQGSLKKTLAETFPGLTDSLLSKKRAEDIKARFFEVTATGAFLLSYPVDHLDKYFCLNKEIAIYEDVEDLISKIKYYLKHSSERKTIAEAGYLRTQKDHSYEKRFKKIFNQIGL